MLSGCVAFAQAGAWARQRTGSMAWLHSVFFLDQNRGWAIGSKGTLLATNDGGKTWQPRQSSTTDVLRDIYFVDNNNGWLVCEVNFYELKTKDQPRAYLMHTTDGGEKWEQVNIKGVDVDSRLVRAVFSQGGRGWAFGEAGAIFTTRDNGATWTRLPSPTRHLLLGGIFIDEDRGWLVGAGATIIQTSDGGDTWYQSRLPQSTQAADQVCLRFVCRTTVLVGPLVAAELSIEQLMVGGPGSHRFPVLPSISTT